LIKPGIVRFVLASLVVFFHITKFVFIGELAVFCFFILSGYWVSLMYENKYAEKKNPIFVFCCSRILRLAPIFYLVSLLNFIMLYFYKREALNFLASFNLDTVFFWFSNIFLVGYNQIHSQPLVPAWSLDIEMQFYLLLPFLLLLMKSKINRFICTITSFLLSLTLFMFLDDLYVSKTILKYLVYFIIGVSIYKSKIKFDNKTEKGFNILFLAILIIHYAIPELFNLVKTTSNGYNGLFNILTSFLLIPLLTNSVLRKSNPKDMFLGGMSYVLYLSHWMFIIPYNFYIREISKTERIPYTTVYLLITYLFSFLVFKYFDTPLDQLRKKWVSSRE
jgi:peptidoglycan/LPS O-acetylase OafA/YrhL